MPAIDIELTKSDLELLEKYSIEEYNSLIKEVGAKKACKIINKNFNKSFTFKEKIILLFKKITMQKTHNFEYKILSYNINKIITRRINNGK